MITKSQPASLFLDVSIKENRLNVSLSDEDTPFYQNEEIPFNCDDIERLCVEVRCLLNKSQASGYLSSGLLQELKKVCHLLYDRLLTSRVKGRLKNTGCDNLVIRMDERLVFIPWELLYNGEDFLCLAFNTGRRVITTQPLADRFQRQPRIPLKMLVLADPTGDLPAAHMEVARIRGQLDCNREVLAVSAKAGGITVDYVTRNIRDYDFIHFAGHTDYEEADPSLSGWRMSDGRFSGREIQKMQGGSPFPALVFLNSCQSASVFADGLLSSALRPGSGPTLSKIEGPASPDMAENIKEGYEQKCFGLVHAFLSAGIRHYIGTLWAIPDSVGLVVAEEFYRRIKEGASIGEALRQARLKAMKEFGEENIVWAGYVLYGDPKYAPFPRGLKSFPQWRSNSRFILKVRLLLSIVAFLLVAMAALFTSRWMTTSTDFSTALIQDRFPKENLDIRDDRLSQLVMPSPGDSAVLAEIKQRFGEARNANDPASAAQACYDLAQYLKEVTLEEMVFSSGKENPGDTKQKISDAQNTLIDLYRTAGQYAQQVRNERLAAYALLGTAEVNRWRGEAHVAIADYEKAAHMLATLIPRREPDSFSLVSAQIDLARLYALNNLDFIKAEEALNKIPSLLKDIPDPEGRWIDMKLVILRRYDYLLDQLAAGRYANSRFAARARAMRQTLPGLLNIPR